ncbi:MAG: DUF1043 family protein [Kistimonas sp.]|nr:DUF1043 family protein [Kistimonas sp.]
MEIESVLWITGLTGFITGLVLGSALYHLLRGRHTGVRAATRLSAQEQAIDAYRKQVARHLDTSTELFDRLTDSWRDLQSHLASGTRTLCFPEKLHSVDDSPSPPLTEPPRDYAPRNESGEGTLSEGFRINKPSGSNRQAPEKQNAPGSV